MKAVVRAAPWCAVASPVLFVLSGILAVAATGMYDNRISDSPQPLLADQRFQADFVAGVALGVLDLALLAQVVAGVAVAHVVKSWQRAGRWPLVTAVAGYVAGAAGVLTVVPALFNSTLLASVLLGIFTAALCAFLLGLNVAGRQAGLLVGGLGTFGVVTSVIVGIAAASWIVDVVVAAGAGLVALLVYFVWSIWFGAELRRMWGGVSR